MIVNHSLVCLLHNDPLTRGSFRNVTLSKIRSMSNEAARSFLKELYLENVSRLHTLLDYLKRIHVTSYRVSSSLFPMMTHPEYIVIAKDIFEDVVFDKLKSYDYSSFELSTHPGQFTMLTSLREDVNDMSIIELNMWGEISRYLPIDVINIHGGARSLGFDHHRKLFNSNFAKLTQRTAGRLSLENDEKSYNASEILLMCQDVGCMMVYDFHHQRCFEKRSKDISIEEVDLQNFEIICSAVQTYKTATPLFHLSSPKSGWRSGGFKDWCAHADFIDIQDYPTSTLTHPDFRSLSYSMRLDIEAKHKQLALAKLIMDLTI